MKRIIYFGLFALGSSKFIRVFEIIDGELTCYATGDNTEDSTLQSAKKIFEDEGGYIDDSVTFKNLLNVN